MRLDGRSGEEVGAKEKEGVMNAFMNPPRDTATNQDFPFKFTPGPVSVSAPAPMPVPVSGALLSFPSTALTPAEEVSNVSEEHSAKRERRGLTDLSTGDSTCLLDLSISQQAPEKEAMPTLSSVADPKSFMIAPHAYGFSVSLGGEHKEAVRGGGGGGEGGQGTEGKAQAGESGVTTPVLLDAPLARLHKEGEEEGVGARVHMRMVPSSDDVSMLPQGLYFMCVTRSE